MSTVVDPASEISVVIVNWNSKDDLRDCLDSLREQDDQGFETIVVDNGSTDGSIELVRDQFPEIVLVATGENLGFAEGCNRGIASASKPWIATLNNDAVTARDWIARLREAVRAGDERLGMIQCCILFKQHPGRTNSTGVYLMPNGGARDRDYDAPLRANEPPSEVFCPSAGAAVYRRTMLDDCKLRTGYFDRTFFMYYEDVDLGWRCRLAGWQAIYLPQAIVFHRFHGSASRRGKHFVELQCAKNRLRYLAKNASPQLLVRSIPKTIVDLGWSLWSGGPRALGEAARAIRDGARERPEVERRRRVDRREIERAWVRPRTDTRRDPVG
jgi:GT2 family glycosyltransferase